MLSVLSIPSQTFIPSLLLNINLESSELSLKREIYNTYLNLRKFEDAQKEYDLLLAEVTRSDELARDILHKYNPDMKDKPTLRLRDVTKDIVDLKWYNHMEDLLVQNKDHLLNYSKIKKARKAREQAHEEECIVRSKNHILKTYGKKLFEKQSEQAQEE